MLLYAGIFLVLSNAVTSRRDKSILYSRIVIAILICSIFLSVNSLNLEFINNGIGILGGLYNITIINLSFHIVILILTSLILQLNGFYPRKIWKKELSTVTGLIFNKLVYYNNFILNKMSVQYKIIEYPLIILFIVIGTTFLVASSDLVSLFLAIELQSYGLYILCSVYRNSERSISGGLTYFLLGGLSSTFILLASSLLYGNSGNTSFDSLYVINNISNLVTESKSFGWYDSYYFNFSLIIMSVGLLFKVSAAPFHFWSPDVYDAIPTVVTTFVAIITKISLFILLLELVHFTTGFFQHDNFSWTISLLISSMLSLIVGSVLGLTQFRIKRLYAYSTISHVGFILLALSVNTVESIQSFIFYLIQYSICNLNAFLILILIGYSLYCYIEIKGKDKLTFSNLENNEQLLDKNNSPIQLVRQLKGYFNINSYLALSLTITLFSFVGIPPLIGFFAKQMVLTSALDNGYVFITFIAILTSVISAYYYLALIKQMFFHKTDYQLNSSLQSMTSIASIENKTNNLNKDTLVIGINDIKLSSALTTTVSLLTLIILLFIIIPNEWLNMANILSLILFSL